MAYMSQELKKELAPAIKAALKKHGLKGSISVRHHMALVVKIKSGSIDFNNLRNRNKWQTPDADLPDGYSVNVSHIDSSWVGDAKAALEDIHSAMNKGNHNNSDIMTDYFDVGWYSDISLGSSWDKPYILEA